MSTNGVMNFHGIFNRKNYPNLTFNNPVYSNIR
jgi:hypothetical protein